MNPIDSVKKLLYSGRFAEALRELEGSRIPSDSRIEAQVLRAELMERVGRPGVARSVVEALLTVKDLSASNRGRCEVVLGKAATEDARVEEAIAHLQRAVSIFERCNDLTGSCRAHISLMLLVSRSGPDAATPLIARLRRNATMLGDPITTAALHVYVGEIEVKRGLLDVGYRHAVIALGILRSSPNVWLEATAETIRFAVSILRADLHDALRFGLRALDLAEESGGAGIQRSCLGNLGNYFLATGDLERAAGYFQRALSVFPSDGENNNATLDSLARVRLAQDRFEDCEVLLERIDASIRCESDRALYAHRYAELTRTHLLAHQKRSDLALAHTDVVLQLSERSGDELLRRTAILLKADLLQEVGRIDESMDAIQTVIPHFSDSSIAMYAHYERLIAAAISRSGDMDGGRYHRDRVTRIHEACGTTYGFLDSFASVRHEAISEVGEMGGNQRAALSSVFQSVSAIVGFASNFELTARELLAILKRTDSAHSAKVIRRGPDGTHSLLVQFGDESETPSGQDERALFVGERDGSAIELIVRPKRDIESIATIGSAEMLLSRLGELQRAKAERDQRGTLWPFDDLLFEHGQAVIAGHMRELMTLVQRVARADISVLILGESGTGKEIIARAIHDASDRAKNAFVPVNCASVPRELMESQLFGHRRGAFTGADRDFAGFIRTARDGTLFLDEIAELGLDLQPKLLRFLESGEIAPIGEPVPIHVKVRVLAATNKNLEELVREGKFREDLFYRLNVVPLTIRPLRERRDEIPGLVRHFVDDAAAQFKKGHLPIAEETMERLLLYRWPGNVRQLQHEIQRIVALAEPNSTLMPDAISEEILGALPLDHPVPPRREMAVSLNEKLPSTIARIESEMIKIALRDNRGKVDATAKALGISRKGLYLKRQRLGL